MQFIAFFSKLVRVFNIEVVMNIFVAGLPVIFGKRELGEMFEAYGQVTAVRIIKDRETGVSRGLGFVEMPDDAEARMAIKNLHDNLIEENKITVKEARPRD